MKTMRDQLREVEKQTTSLDKELQINGSKVEQLQGKYQGLEKKLSVQSNITQRYKTEITRLATSLEEKRKALEKANQEYENGKQVLDENSKELKKLAKEQANLEKSVSSTEKAYNKYQQELSTSAQKEKTLQAELQKTKKDLQTQQTYITQVNDAYKSMQEKTAGIRSGMSTAGKTLTTGVTLPLIAAGVAAVNYASDLEESQNKVDVAFGNSASIVSDFAKTTNEAYGIAEGTALDMAALFGDMGTSMGIPQDEAADMAKTLVGLAGDLASFKNIDLDRVSTGLKGIFSGETESLKELGVVMTEQNVQAYALANGLLKADKSALQLQKESVKLRDAQDKYNKAVQKYGADSLQAEKAQISLQEAIDAANKEGEVQWDELSQAEKVMLRYQYVLDATKNAQGDYARTADGTANSLRTFQESTKELAASFGQELLPVITPMIQGATDMVQKFGELDEEQKQMILKIAAVAAAAGPVLSIASKGITVVNGVASAVKALGSGVGSLGKLLPALVSPAGATTLAILGITAAVGGTVYAIATAHDRSVKEFAEMGDAAVEAGDKYQEAAQKASTVEGMADEWAALNQKIDDGKLSAEELAGAEQRRKDIEQWFIDNYGDYISAEEQKHGIRQDSIESIEDETKALSEKAKLELQNKLLDMEPQLPNNIERIKYLQEENEKLEDNHLLLLEQQAKYKELQNAFKSEVQGKTGEEQARIIEKYNKALQELAKTYKDDKFSGDIGIGLLGGAIQAAADEADKLEGKLNKNNEELGTLNEGVSEYVQTAGMLADVNLGGHYDEITQSLFDLMDAYNEVTTTGQITDDTLQKIIDDVPGIAEASDKPYVLADAIEYLCDKLEDAGVDLDTLLFSLDKIKPNYDTTVRVNTVYKNPIFQEPRRSSGDIYSNWITANATGTSYARRGLSVVNEKGPELIESRDGTYRIAEGSPAITYLEQGDKVYTAAQTRKMARAGGIPNFAEGKSAFENAREAFRHTQNTSEVSTMDALVWWKNALQAYADDADAVKEANEEIYKLTKELKKEQADDYKDMVSDFISEDERWNDQQQRYGTISQENYLWNLGNRADQYRKFADEVMTLDYMTEEERLKLREEYIDKAEDLDLEYFETWKEMANEALEYQRELQNTYLSDRAFWGDWGGDDPLAAYDRIKQQEIQAVTDGLQTWDDYDRRMSEVGKSMYDDRVTASFKWLDQMEKYGVLSDEDYLAGLERIRQYTDEYYRAGMLTEREYAEAIEALNDKTFDRYKGLLDEQVDAYYDAQQAQLDARKQAIEDAYAAEEKAEKQADRKAQLQELLEQERMFAGAVTIEGKQKLQDIRDQIADLEKQQRDEEREEEKQAQLDAIAEQEKNLEEQHQNTLNATSKFAAQMVGVIDGGNQELSDSFSALIQQQSLNQEKILQEGYNAVSSLVAQTNAKMSELITFDGSVFSTLGQIQAGRTSNSYIVEQHITNQINDRTDADAFASSINRAAWGSMYAK